MAQMELFEEAYITQLYDFMACIIRSFLDNKNVSIDMLYAEAAKKEEDVYWDWPLDGSEDSLTDIDIDTKSDLQKLDALQWADWRAGKAREEFLWEEGVLAPAILHMDGLNSEESRKKTNILLLPRYKCIWEGESREENHRIDINSLLRDSFYVEILNGKVNEKYTPVLHLLNPQFFNICMREENTLFLSLAVSPVTDQVKIDEGKNYRKYEDEDNGIKQKWFAIDNLYDKQTEDAVTQYIKTVVCKAAEGGNQILVFPEMLGTEAMKDSVVGFIKNLGINPLQFIVFPSIWKFKENHKGHNTSYFIDGNGNEWFGQEKLRRYPMKDGDKTIFWEDIEEGEKVHLVYGQGYGCMAIAICRSELDQNIRDMLIKQLNVKLILCPSWSSGSSYEFEASLLAGAEMSCNVAWCNTCSALENTKQGEEVRNGEAQDEQTVGIVTVFGKNKTRSRLSLDEGRFTNSACKAACDGGCIFSKVIYGIDLKRGKGVEEDDSKSVGNEKPYIDDGGKEERETAEYV